MTREFQVFGSTVVGVDGGAMIEAGHGCDGNIHVDWVSKVWVGPDNEVTYAENLQFVERGFCPRRRTHSKPCGSDGLGGFLYEY